MRPAAFLDRDGTIIREEHYLADPARVALLPGAAAGIKALRSAGFACVVVSNQSGVGRGLLTLETLELIHAEFCRQLADEGASIDGWYFCPAVPSSSDRTMPDHPERKPAPGMLLRAARELDLDVSSSWMVGDMISDVLAGRNAGCRGSVLVRTGYGSGNEEAARLADHVALSLREAADWIITQSMNPSGPAAAPRSVDASEE